MVVVVVVVLRAAWSRRHGPADDVWAMSTPRPLDAVDEVGRNAMLSGRISASRQPSRQPLIAADRRRRRARPPDVVRQEFIGRVGTC